MLFCLFFFFAPTAHAETHVSGVPENYSWTAANSPYIVDGNVGVPSGQTLSIADGVTVQFSSGTGLFVYGVLQASGNGTGITFTSASTTPVAGDWYAIVFEPGSSGTISYANITYGGGRCTGCANALIYNDGGDITLSHVALSNSGASGMRQSAGTTSYPSSATISDSLLEHNGDGYQGLGIILEGGSLASATKDLTCGMPGVTGGPSGPVGSDSASFSWSTYGGDAIACRIDNGSWNSCTSPDEYTNLDPGAHTWDVRATTNSPSGTAIASMSWFIDLDAPTLAFTSPENNAETTASHIVVFGTIDGTGTDGMAVMVNGTYCSVHGGSTWRCDVPLTAGTNYLTATGYDGAWNSANAYLTVVRN